MNTKRNIIFSVFVLVLFAVGAYFWGTASTESYFSFQSPLHDKPMQTGEALGRPSTRRLIWVLIDGLRYDTSLDSKLMPVFNQLRSNGAQARMHSRPPSYSQPGYSTILTGAWPGVNDGPLFNANVDQIGELSIDTIFSVAHRSGIKTAISAYYWFDQLLPDSELDRKFFTEGEDAAADVDVVNAALPWLADGEEQFLLIHIDQVDYASHHEGGALGAGLAAAASRSDALLGQIVSKLDLTQDTIMVFSDHGHIDAGGHGGDDAVTLLEPMVAVGKGIRPGNYGDINMVDLSPTGALLLGTSLPAGTQGQALVDMLDVQPSKLQALASAVQIQQTALLKTYASAIGQLLPGDLPHGSDVAAYQAVLENIRQQKLNGERILRGGLALILLVGCAWLLVRLSGKRLIWYLVGISLYLLSFNFRYAILDGKVFSYSGVADADTLLVYVISTALIGALLGWGMVVLGVRSLLLPRWESTWVTINYGLLLLFFVALPVWLNFTLNGITVTWAAPDVRAAYLGLLSLIQIMGISGATLIFGLISFLLAKPKDRALQN